MERRKDNPSRAIRSESVRRQDRGVPSRRRFPDSVGVAPIAGSHSKSRRKHHIKTKTMLSALYFDIQTRRAVTFCHFSVALFVSENRQIVLLNLIFKCHSRRHSWHLDQLKAILNFLLRRRCLQECFGRGVSARRAALLPWRVGEFWGHKECLVSLGEGDF